MRICIVDGQGGGIGKELVEKLKKVLSSDIKITALGTNSAATVIMLKAGANEGATGENAIVYNANKADVIAGPLGIIMANSMMGELTPLMARAISESDAYKVLIPISKCNAVVAGTEDISMPLLIDQAVEDIAKRIKNRSQHG